MPRFPSPFSAIALTPFIALHLHAQQPAAAPAAASATIAQRTQGMDRRDGFIPVVLDHREGKLYLEIPHDSTRALLFAAQSTGLGSNPIGIDRAGNGPSWGA